ncbi:alpha/beta fold hydrolase [Ottowia thiooxydans]|uniref:alpha/beta fold hydrolase n=1 Tax=Ottowia thiooxydans TaxID=219182 RepID=UPI0004064233|nr:alpha/beta fold hydrolase [Ottowia thiooxydans]
MKLGRTFFSFSAGLIGAASIFGLSACGGDGTPDPLQKYREQTVQWTHCDPTILGEENNTLSTLDPSVGERLRCSYVRAPLDWSNTERGDVVVAVMRLAAGTPEKRQGSLLFNPGGPGQDGLADALSLFSAFANSNPDNPQGARQLRLLNEFDMVGFSPRGTGASTRLECSTNELEREVDMSAAEWDTPENIENATYNNAKTAQACLKNPITPYINTDATARDMDLLRGLLGDEKLNYVGYSYGTWLGSWYANLFPEKVGRMVLDSSLDFTSTFDDALEVGQPLARQRLLDEVMIPYAVRHEDHFRLGSTGTEVSAVISALSPGVQQSLIGGLTKLTYSRTSANEFLANISAAQALDAVLKAAPDPADTAAIQEDLDEYVLDPVNPVRNEALRSVLKSLYAVYLERAEAKPSSFNLDSSEAVRAAVTCNDTLAITDSTTWVERIRGVAQRAPLFFAAMLQNPCSFWGGPTVSKPALTPMKSLNVLMVQSQYDAATNTDGANTFFAQLPAARRVYVSGDFQHAIYPYVDSCVDPIVTNYLLGESPAQRETVCTGHPLELDALNLNSSTKAASVSPIYKDAERARELIERFKRGAMGLKP